VREQLGRLAWWGYNSTRPEGGKETAEAKARDRESERPQHAALAGCNPGPAGAGCKLECRYE